ncbi:MAG: hypothetical protein M1833_006495 [Piccolia ochrophora]|nr:MAG: hypothetical protein M1833_006495 [Piccolia ochrophora]
MDNGSHVPPQGDARKHNYSSTPKSGKPQASGATSSGHKRSLSGSLLAKLPFLRQNTPDSGLPDNATNSKSSERKDAAASWEVGAMATTVQEQNKSTRRRKGSLRKTALLGTGRPRVDARDQKGANVDAAGPNDGSQRDLQARYITDAAESDGSPTSLDDSRSIWGFQLAIPGKKTLVQGGYLGGPLAALDTKQQPAPIEGFGPALRSPTETSTTDEDDGLTFGAQSSKRTPSSNSNSYFPPVPASPERPERRRSTKHAQSPLSAPPVVSSEDWDYSETETWGWVVLIVTWVVFVVGMGSCLEVWSWAWDVGETPYAPPELEDDPTLPIVGYYPALIILTTVMAWVWVVAAWVGMKYFKHAKISSDN